MEDSPRPAAFILNRDDVSTSWPAERMLLDFLRQERRLTGTKEGCREGECGACTVLLGKLEGESLRYRPVNSCLLPMGEVAGAHVVTIEGLNGEGLTPVQQALVDAGAVQCGFCTPGIVVALTGYFVNADRWEAQEAVSSLDGNLCRCTGYLSMKRAVSSLCSALQPPWKNSRDVSPAMEARLEGLVQCGLLPGYFLDIPRRLTLLREQGEHVLPFDPRESTPVAGGTDFFLQHRADDGRPKLFFLSSREDLRGIHIHDGVCRIGAATTVEEMVRSEVLAAILPHVKEHLGLFGTTAIRARATVGGNLVNASPAADVAIILLALGATVGLAEGKKRRQVALKDFFKGYKLLDKAPDEWVEWVQFPLPSRNAAFHFEKVSRRPRGDVAGVNSAILLEVDGGVIRHAHLSVGGVAPVPFYLAETVKFLEGSELTLEVVSEAAAVAQGEISPISDVRGSADYKRLLLRQLVLAHFLTLYPSLAGKGCLHGAP
ncbi:FAD binding domain-containing protein [Desulforhabdus sp. TSK]|uniref:FAD binding domain-containing protein n=1 Tax=Desulforhabdus sp. TSK TaxID=2925014 RepID=UPI001FC7FA34|nr:FAD binding domain-containing protein [Desulforhabdus sp. TSK]GKT06707.1 xanthine dehydrogenase small subunit [Desulforhabdus sp. TSK]